MNGLDVMLDLETMGTKHNAAIVSIGAVVFSTEGLGAEFYTRVSLRSAVEGGGTIDPDTVVWWLQQSDAARHELTMDGIPLYTALEEFSRWMSAITARNMDARVWGNGSDFDNAILATAYQIDERPLPWKFYNNRCFRTLKNIGVKVAAPTRAGTHHNALDDAKFQAEWAVSIFRQLNQVKELI